MPRLEKMGLEGELGALKVIISMQIFGELKCDDKWYYHEGFRNMRFPVKVFVVTNTKVLEIWTWIDPFPKKLEKRNRLQGFRIRSE